MGKQKIDFLDPDGAKKRFFDNFETLAKKTINSLKDHLDKQEKESAAKEFLDKHPKRK